MRVDDVFGWQLGARDVVEPCGSAGPEEAAMEQHVRGVWRDRDLCLVSLPIGGLAELDEIHERHKRAVRVVLIDRHIRESATLDVARLQAPAYQICRAGLDGQRTRPGIAHLGDFVVDAARRVPRDLLVSDYR